MELVTESVSCNTNRLTTDTTHPLSLILLRQIEVRGSIFRLSCSDNSVCAGADIQFQFQNQFQRSIYRLGDEGNSSPLTIWKTGNRLVYFLIGPPQPGHPTQIFAMFVDQNAAHRRTIISTEFRVVDHTTYMPQIPIPYTANCFAVVGGYIVVPDSSCRRLVLYHQNTHQSVMHVSCSEILNVFDMCGVPGENAVVIVNAMGVFKVDMNHQRGGMVWKITSLPNPRHITCDNEGHIYVVSGNESTQVQVYVLRIDTGSINFPTKHLGYLAYFHEH